MFNIRGDDKLGCLWPRLGVGEGGGSPTMGVQELLPLENFVFQTVHFGEYLCNNLSKELVHFAVLNTNVEVFLNQFSYSTAT